MVSVDRASHQRLSAVRGLGAQHGDMWHHQRDRRRVGFYEEVRTLECVWLLSTKCRHRSHVSLSCPCTGSLPKTKPNLDPKSHTHTSDSIRMQQRGCLLALIDGITFLQSIGSMFNWVLIIRPRWSPLKLFKVCGRDVDPRWGILQHEVLKCFL